MTYTEEEIQELELHFSISNWYTSSFCFRVTGFGGFPPSPQTEGRSYGVCFICGFGFHLKQVFKYNYGPKTPCDKSNWFW